MPTKERKTLKKKKLRNNEYYNMQSIFDNLYKRSKQNQNFNKIYNLIISKENILLAYRNIKSNKGGKTKGINNTTILDIGNLDEDKIVNYVRHRLQDYKPHSIRRKYIPKKNGKLRPLGIPTIEDRLIQQCFLQILEPILEAKFHNDSYGFRPNRSTHNAIAKSYYYINNCKCHYVVDVDIKGFFDNVDHEWLMKMLAHDIADRKFLEIIDKFLKAGVMENGKYLDSEQGTPQGNGASPILANIYLHYVLDNWFDVIVKRQCKGECYLIRYCDDFVCCFQNQYEAKIFKQRLEERFAKYGLELAGEKTKILEFGRFARHNRKARGERKPDTLDFLGFTFYCGMDGKREFFRCRVKTSKKKFRSKIKAMKEWIKAHRAMPLELIFKTVNAKLRGHYQYYGVTDNTREVKNFLVQTKWLLYKWLNRRSQKRSYTSDTFFNGLLRTFPLLEPSIKVSLFYR